MFEFIASAILLLSIILTIQGIFNLYLMLYVWENPMRIEKNRSPRVFERPSISFTAIIPARHEEQVIGDTIRAVSSIEYPPDKTEIIIVLRSDDQGTIKAAHNALQTLKRQHARVVVFDDKPINKPHGLNFALPCAKNDVVVVFDAEDEPHRNIYNIVNTIMLREKADVVQSGVQLINFHSNWYSTFNVTEYFFWFKSCLQYFASQGVIPLGGNTVFISRQKLLQVKGWDEHCLTEDADMGIKLSLIGAKIKVVYDEEHTTREETPPTLKSFIKQRTRWNQGFMQIIHKGQWRKLPSLKHRLLALYVLGWPLIQAFLFILLPVSVIIAVTMRFPEFVTLSSIIPVFILLLQMSVAIIGLWEFSKDYKLSFPFKYVLVMIISFIPYQIILGYASLRAGTRFLKSNTAWEKTDHINAHRK